MPFPLLGGTQPPFPEELDYGASTLSFAGTSAALASGPDSLSTNPAGLMYFGGISSVGADWSNPPGNGDRWSATIIDGSSEIIGGFRFSWTNWDPARRHDYRMAVAYKTPWCAVGASAFATQMRDVTRAKGWHFSNGAGVLAPLLEGLTVGAFTTSLFDFENDSTLPPSIHGGIAYAKAKQFRVGFDADRRIQVTGSDWNYSTGAEFLLHEFFILRGGYHWDHRPRQNYWAVGGGMLAPKIDIIGAYTQTQDSPLKKGVSVDIALRF